MNESYGRSHASLHCTTFRRPAYQMANWPLNLMWMDPRILRWYGCKKVAGGGRSSR